MKKESVILAILIVLVAAPVVWLIQQCLSSSKDILAKYNVHHVEYITIDNRNVSIVYQIKNIKNISSINNNDIDGESKTEICYIVWYMFNEYQNIDEVQIISYYPHEGKLKPYYEFKIDRRTVELIGLLNISKEDLSNNLHHYCNKILRLGILKIHRR